MAKEKSIFLLSNNLVTDGTNNPVSAGRKENANLKENKKIIEYLSKIENPYTIKLEDMAVEIEYSENNKNFNECILSILEQKLR